MFMTQGATMKPVRFCWTADGVMQPHPRAHELCDKQYVIGEWYVLEVREERSYASHGHYFACLNEVWNNLPPELTARWPSVDHMRAWALVETGFCDIDERMFETRRDALEAASYARAKDPYAVIRVKRKTMWVGTAWSQSRRHMNKKQFQDSKDAVLRRISEVIGVDTATLSANAGRAA